MGKRKVRRGYKDSLFRMVFREKKELLSLYNAINGTNYDDPDMPLRGLLYITMLYQGFIEQNHLDIYSSSLLKLPIPRYIVFYNGTSDEPDEQELRLSDSFVKQDNQSCLECRATVLNINYGRSKELLEACRKLYTLKGIP